MEKTKYPDFLFEVSWEVCNKVGGIYTVVSTKALSIAKRMKDNFILIGPDLDREGHTNPEFEEDTELYQSWRASLKQKGLNVKVGRWKIIGKPIVFLIDFSPLFSKKDQIFTELWTEYHLDSLSGQWDYIEPAMFGYAAGMVIKSFNDYNLNAGKKVVSQFHEWMTGTGLLYLEKYAPQIATVFTTHATVLGRSIAGNNLPLYSLLGKIDSLAKVKEFNVVSKHSLESISAMEADVFTTVSELTAKEAYHFLGKEVDFVTPNGFEDNIVPSDGDYIKIRQKAVDKLKKVAEALLGYQLSDDVKFIGTSGRYEFKNKGLDAFIDAVAELNNKEKFNKEIVAYILVPANNYGARKDLIAKLNGQIDDELENKFLTHYLHDADFDPILKKIKEKNFTNAKEQKAKIIFVPAYLNGSDGIFNMKYYDLLTGFRITAFPSYYEPWGYTPLESLAFHVPTITTTLTGFGLWIKNQNVELGECLSVIYRDDQNYSEVVEKIAGVFITCAYKNNEEEEFEKNNAFFISKTAQWKNLVKYYFSAYNVAIERSRERTRDMVIEQVSEKILELPKIKTSKPIWRTASVKPNLPEKFKGLDELSKNIWWEWNSQAIDLFKKIDPKIWEKSDRNPVKLLKDVDYQRLLKLEKDIDFLAHYQEVYHNFKNYLNTKAEKKLPAIAYFSMEFGLTNTLKIYSGGLGILAGDYLKQASDKNIPMVGVGLLYKYGYFTQKLSIRGEQIVALEPQNFSDLPLELVHDEVGKPVIVHVGLPGRLVYMQIWRVNVGRVPLYLLDTDIELNSLQDRSITHQLYGGDNENRLKQEIVLGIGGIRALRAMKIRPDVYHSNEGHSAFIGIERVQQYMAEKHLTFAEAVEIVRASTLFTTHTPVPAGHDAFPEDLMMQYFGHIPERLKISWEQFVKLGKINPWDKHEKFSMSNLASNLSQEINGVSYLHGEVTKEMFKKLWEGYFPEELHIGYVTNGVHYQTWASDEWKKIIDKYFDEDSSKLLHDPKVWSKIYEIPDKEIWELRNKMRAELIHFIKHRINSHYVRQRKSPQQIVAIQNKVNEKILTLGFARRFATYKRAHLLFYDTARLSAILNNPDFPVQIVFAGKAHPADVQGQEIIKRIIEISKLPQFLGKILFLENYDIELAKKLVQGVDLWINTPTRPLEASGTSGMKATMNGVLNLSVLDGWWVEGYKQGAGWALPMERTYENQEFQNQLDAEMIYEMLENDIVPKFYKRDEEDVPREWIQFIKKAIAQIAPEYTTARMIDDYIKKFYTKLAQRKAKLKADDYAKVKDISAWKKRMLFAWDNIEVIEVIEPQYENKELVVGHTYVGELKLDLKDINPQHIGVELVIVEKDKDKEKILQKDEMKLVEIQGTIVKYRINVRPAKSGIFHYAFRVYPKHKDLPHRQDFPIVKWI
jgi:phosphorylase/glycogen(starch) synthase